MIDNFQDFYSIQDFANLIKVHHNTVRRAIKTGHINAFRTNNGPKSSFRIPRSEINKMSMDQYVKLTQKQGI